MKRENFRPSSLGDARIEKPSTLVFVRELRAPPERVWAALTDPAKIAQWAPFDASDLATTGSAALVAGGTGDPSETSAIVVKRADPPRVLEYTWGNDLLHWSSSRSRPARLTLRHTVEDAGWLWITGLAHVLSTSWTMRSLGTRSVASSVPRRSSSAGATSRRAMSPCWRARARRRVTVVVWRVMHDVIVHGDCCPSGALCPATRSRTTSRCSRRAPTTARR